MKTHTQEWKTGEETPPRPWKEEGEIPQDRLQEEEGQSFPKKEEMDPENGETDEFEGQNPSEEEGEEGDGEEPVEWDGSEAQLVLDDDAAEYESPQTGIRLSCDLREQEIFEALSRFPFTKRAGKRALIEAGVLLAAACVFLYQYFGLKTGQAMFFAVACVILAAVVLFVPWLGRRRMASRMAKDPNKSHVEMEIYPDSIDMGREGKQWEIPLDGTCEMEEYKNMILLFPAGKNAMVILPLRSIEPSVLPEVQGMLLSGTSKRETEEGL